VMFANIFGIIGYILLLTAKHNGKFTRTIADVLADVAIRR
jgi:hypothetical protein